MNALPTVFIVDDDPAMRDSLGFLIGSVGRKVETYASAEEFLDAYENAWQEVIVEESEKNANFKKIYASYSKFREDFALWGDNGYLKR